MKYHPAPGFILVKPLKEEKIGSLTVSDNMSDKDSSGIVVACGAGFTFFEGNNSVQVPCPVKIGDRVVYPNMGTNAVLDFKTGQRLHFVRFHCDPVWTQLLAIIDD